MSALSQSNTASSTPYQAPGGELVLTEVDFKRIAELLHLETGICLPENKSQLVSSRLGKRMRSLGLKRFEDYCKLVTTGGSSGELSHMIAALTTNVTRFFREEHHFEHLKENVLPNLIAAAKNGERIRLWSAACSSGEEAYSMAITLLSVLPNASTYDIKVLATDIDPVVVDRAKAGIYAGTETDGIAEPLKKRFFKPAPDGRADAIQVADEVRKLISFKQLNLIRAWPMSGPFQVIFCRNVVIYFDEPTKVDLWARFSEIISPNGVLYVGHSERVAGPAENIMRTDGITAYRKVGGGLS